MSAMSIRVLYSRLLLLHATGIATLSVVVGAPDVSLQKIQLPDGFSIRIYAAELPDARSLARGDSGTVFVGTRVRGRVYAAVDRDGDHKVDEVFTLLEGLYMPNGVAIRDGSLFVAETNRVLRYDDIEENLSSPPDPVVVVDGLPRDRHHGWKFIRFGPDGRLYIPIGAPCNICDPEDPRYAAISRVATDGSGFEVFANGVRNTVGFDWHPADDVLWFTDNGRDWLGDDTPPEELNRAAEAGLHFGYPYCHGTNLPDPEFGKDKDCGDYTPPALELSPHAAALGMRFYTGGMFPEKYRNHLLIAEHGSWNRKDPIGYRLTFVRIENGKASPFEIFAEGWLQEGKAWGRPVDIEVMPDGALLVSDDLAGVLYRISYSDR